MARKGKKAKFSRRQRLKTKKSTAPGAASFQKKTLQEALTLHQTGRLPQAEALYRQILSSEPDNPDALHYLGLLAHQVGKSASGVDLIKSALQYRPDYTEALVNLGAILNEMGKLDEAVIILGRALKLKHDNAMLRYNLGNALHGKGRLDEAISHFRQAITAKSDYAPAHNNLGISLGDMGRLAEAIASFRRALRLNPGDALAHNNLGFTLYKQGQFDEASVSLHQAIKLKPDYAEAHNNLGNVCKDTARLEEAVNCYQQALALKPDYAEAYNNLGNTFKDMGQLDKAIASYRQAITLKADYALAQSNLLMCLCYLPRQNTENYLAEAHNYRKIAASKVTGRFSDWRHDTKPNSLRVGLVSGDFHSHPVGFFLENMLDHIDPKRIELFGFPIHHKQDDLTERIRPRFAAWKPLLGLHDEDAAHLIHGCGIHILLDLSGHTSFNRLPVFSWKPAPVQATWLGYFASTGIAEMDFIIADRVSVPEQSREHFTERVWHLPDTRLCFSPPLAFDEMTPTHLPASQNGFITFGCFQNLAKVNDEVLTAWGRIMRGLPHSKIRFQDRRFDSLTVKEQMLQRLAQIGISPDRVRFETRTSRQEYLAAHAHIDMILDTFPFNGGTTTCEALWMGVPTLTIAGSTMIARQGASLLTCAGLKDWIGYDPEDYVATALAQAADLENLARLRAGLRRQILESPLCDGARFARNFETALHKMWHSFMAHQ